jgi:hypothetical protein
MGGPIFNQPVEGLDTGTGFGVRGSSSRFGGNGVDGVSDSGAGVIGKSKTGRGVEGKSDSNQGVDGVSDSAPGVAGFSRTSVGVFGGSAFGDGVIGSGRFGNGVSGRSGIGDGVHGESGRGSGVFGSSSRGDGVHGESWGGTGVFGFSTFGLAADLDGNVRITGTLHKGGGAFKIDHPLNPANKYLSHSFVESPDMKNVYDGVVVLDDKGEAEIELPDWFGALNKDFRYQLTAIGAPGPNLHIAEEISDGVTNYSNSSNNNSRFKIAGGTSGMKVSWQVTGIRKDPWANAHRIQVEEDKPAEERGYYLYPDLYGKAVEKGISRLLFPEEEEEHKKKQEQLLINENKLT